MIHGLGGTSNMFQPQIAALSGYRIVRVDLPGSGRSSRPIEPLTIEGMSEAVIRAMAGTGVTSAHFVGHSMGTIVCQQIAAMQPALVASLTLFGALAEPAEATRQGLGQPGAPGALRRHFRHSRSDRRQRDFGPYERNIARGSGLRAGINYAPRTPNPTPAPARRWQKSPPSMRAGFPRRPCSSPVTPTRSIRRASPRRLPTRSREPYSRQSIGADTGPRWKVRARAARSSPIF
ncbi:alpha/beta fold hydrolase [Mesorhizobium atlanticum]